MSRHRNARSPLSIPFRGWKDIVLRVKDAVARDHVTLIAAGVAFYLLLSLFPAIAAALAIAGLVIDPQTLVQQLEAAGEILPDEASDIIIGQAQDVAGAQGGGLGLAAALSIAIALWSASRGTRSLIEGLNVAFDETEKRGFLKLTATTLGVTICIIIAAVVALLITAVLPVMLGLFGGGTVVATLIDWARWPVLALFLIVGLGLFYRIGPSRRAATWRWLTPGAAIACLLWIAASVGFSVYVSSFGTYNETFGALGGVVVLLLWLWISAFIILLGAEIDGEIEAQTRHDTTIGEDRPMSERGAAKADKLGERRGDKRGDAAR